MKHNNGDTMNWRITNFSTLEGDKNFDSQYCEIDATLLIGHSDHGKPADIEATLLGSPKSPASEPPALVSESLFYYAFFVLLVDFYYCAALIDKMTISVGTYLLRLLSQVGFVHLKVVRLCVHGCALRW